MLSEGACPSRNTPTQIHPPICPWEFPHRGTGAFAPEGGWVAHTTRFSLCGRREASPQSFGNRSHQLSTSPLKLRRLRAVRAPPRNTEPVEGPRPKPGLAWATRPDFSDQRIRLITRKRIPSVKYA